MTALSSRYTDKHDPLLRGPPVDGRSRWIAGSVALLLVLSGIGIALSGIGRDRTATGTRDGSAENAQVDSAPDDAPDADDASGDDDTAASTTVRGTTQATVRQTAARRRATTVKDTPTPPATSTPTQPTAPDDPTDPPDPDYPGGPAAPNGDPSDGLTRADQLYRQQTREIVESDPVGLQEAAATILAALDAGDEGALGEMLAADEGAQPDYLGYMADHYPTIVTSTSIGTVNIFAAGDATVYMAYALVIWEDAGITSEHTISIPMRFVDGEWRFTSVEYWSDSLEFVQSVEL